MKELTAEDWGYDALVSSFATIVHSVMDDDYQGDTRYLVKDDSGRWGYLINGWGSCSGCDALQDIEPWGDEERESPEALAKLTELRDEMAERVHWEDSAALLATWVKERDWGLYYECHAKETKQFLADIKPILEEAQGRPFYELGTFSGLVGELGELVERNRDGDSEDVTLAVESIVSRHAAAHREK